MKCFQTFPPTSVIDSLFSVQVQNVNIAVILFGFSEIHFW